MSDWWIADEQGRVLGPVGTEVVQELWRSQRLSRSSRVSRDRQNWLPLLALPELVGAEGWEDPESRLSRQRQQVTKILGQMRDLRNRPPHEVFHVPKDAPLAAYREAFFTLSKRFHPVKVPDDAIPELKAACREAFRFLAGLFASIADAPPAPVYTAESFVGLKQRKLGEYDAWVKVGPRSISMFLEHPLCNVRQGGFFVEGLNVLPLGTLLHMKLEMEDRPPRTLLGLGRVALEASILRGRPGYGVSLSSLRQTDRNYLTDYVNKTAAAVSR